MEDPFRGISAAEDKYQLRSLTDNFVFCPKCGMENSFKLSEEGKKLIYFCKRCQSILNNYWDGYTKKRYSVTNCSTCQQPTFRDFKYCISCGSIFVRETTLPSERGLYLQTKVFSQSKKSRMKGLLLISCVLGLMAPGILLFMFGLMMATSGGGGDLQSSLWLGFGIALLVIPPAFMLILQIIKNAKKKRELSTEDK